MSVNRPSFFLESLLQTSLILRGYQTVGLVCDGFQETECNVFGGPWGGGRSFAKNCIRCQAETRALRADSAVEPLSSYAARPKFVTTRLPHSYEELVGLTLRGIPFGRLALDSVRNMHMVEDVTQISGYESLLRKHVRNLMALESAYTTAVQVHNPIAIVSNDSFYGMWNIMERVALENKIPFVSVWPLSSGSKLAVRKGTHAMNLDLSRVWAQYKDEPLSNATRHYVDAWLRRAPSTGRRLQKEFTSAGASLNQYKRWPSFASKYAVLAANVTWDLASLNKQKVFDSMMSWVLQTVRWFIANPHYGLVVRPHPVERDPLVPTTRETVAHRLKQEFGQLPANIHFDDSAEGPIYEWVRDASCVLVSTSTLGLEAACLGKRVVVSGDAPYAGTSFVATPTSMDEYFLAIGKAFLADTQSLGSAEVDMAYKFAHLYLEGYFMDHRLFEAKLWDEPSLMISSLAELQPGRNRALDIVIDSIVGGLDPDDHPDRVWLPV